MQLSVKLLDAGELSAFLVDADEAGYLGPEDSQAVQSARGKFGWLCEEIALDALKGVADPAVARANLRNEILKMHSAFAELSVGNRKSPVLLQLEDGIFNAVERIVTKKEWHRELMRLVHMLPRLFRGAIWILVLFIAALAAKRFFGK